MHHYTTFAALMLSASAASAESMFVKRDSWGPSYGLGPAKAEIISTQTTIYPGPMPANQPGLLFVWMGISNGTGDLIQSIVGSYPAGGSECTGANADTAWCISSEVYGLGPNGGPNQFVGDLRTANPNYENGIKLNYTLIDKSTYLWRQTMTDAVTGVLLSEYEKTSGPMTGWGTAIECNDNNGVACTGTISNQSYVDSTITLASADSTFKDTRGSGTGVTFTDMTTSDNGKTWTIARIDIPAMQSGEAAVAVSADAKVVEAAASTPEPSSALVPVTELPEATTSLPAVEAPELTTSLSGAEPTEVPEPTGSVQFSAPTGSLQVPEPTGSFPAGSFPTGTGALPTGTRGFAFPSGSPSFTRGSARPSGSYRHRGSRWGGRS